MGGSLQLQGREGKSDDPDCVTVADILMCAANNPMFTVNQMSQRTNPSRHEAAAPSSASSAAIKMKSHTSVMHAPHAQAAASTSGKSAPPPRMQLATEKPGPTP